MAQIIETPPPKPDPKKDLLAKLERAPVEHAEALLQGYELLQLAHEKGILELAKGVLGAGENVMWMLTKTMGNDEVLAFSRNMVSLVKIVGALNPVVLEEIEKTLMQEVQSAKAEKPPGLLGIFMRVRSQNGRRFLSTATSLMESLGRNLHLADNQGRKRTKVARHEA